MTIAPTRLAWVDIAKATAIVLIVVFHVSGWFIWYVAPEAAGSPAAAAWTSFSNALIPVRIPLFFFVSGLLARRAIERPWADLIRTRFADVLWPFFVWSALVALPWSARVSPEDRWSNVTTNLSAIALGGAHYWYLPALAFALAVAKLSRRVPWLSLTFFAVTSLLMTTHYAQMSALFGPYLGVNVARWLDFTVWFVVGCFLPRAAGWVSRLNVLWLVGGLTSFVGLRGLLGSTPISCTP